MNSLILVLFLGATVALAEIHIENDPHHKAPRPIIKKCMEKCRIKPTAPGELADEENHHHHRHHYPSLPPDVRKCIKECFEEHKPSKLPTEPGKEADEENDPRRPRPSGVSPRPPRPSGVSPRPPRPSGVSPRPLLPSGSSPRPPRPSGVSPRPPPPSGVSPRPPRPSGASPRPPRFLLDDDCISRSVVCSASLPELMALCD